jgi:hypothetical protein
LLFEPGVLGFGLSIDRKIGVGVFPNVKEFFVRFTGGCVVARHLLRAAELEPGQGSDDMSHAKTRIVDQLLELSRGRLAIAEPHVCESADVGGVHRIDQSRKRQIVLGSAAEQIDGRRRIVLPQLDRGPDGGNEVMLYKRVLGPFRADLVCESTGFRCSS